MSNYTAPTFHPDTGKLEQAAWMNDYYGRHQYGVRFPDGSIHRAQECEQVGPKAAAEIERLRDVIDCGCNAITDAVNLGGPDLIRVKAMVRRMRKEGGCTS